MPSFTPPVSTAVDFALQAFTPPANTALDFDVGGVLVGPTLSSYAEDTSVAGEVSVDALSDTPLAGNGTYYPIEATCLGVTVRTVAIPS